MWVADEEKPTRITKFKLLHCRSLCCHFCRYVSLKTLRNWAFRVTLHSHYNYAYYSHIFILHARAQLFSTLQPQAFFSLQPHYFSHYSRIILHITGTLFCTSQPYYLPHYSQIITFHITAALFCTLQPKYFAHYNHIIFAQYSHITFHITATLLCTFNHITSTLKPQSLFSTLQPFNFLRHSICKFCYQTHYRYVSF